jgi:peptide/nickel transport system permease protein
MSVLWRRALRSRSLVAGVLLTGLIALSAIFAPLLSPDSPEHQDLYHILSGSSWAHPLGTDELGRDELSRLLFAGRTDLKVGVLAIVFPLIFGTLIGTIAGYYRGIADEIISRTIDIVLASSSSARAPVASTSRSRSPTGSSTRAPSVRPR